MGAGILATNTTCSIVTPCEYWIRMAALGGLRMRRWEMTPPSTPVHATAYGGWRVLMARSRPRHARR